MAIAIGIIATGIFIFGVKRMLTPDMIVIGGIDAYMKARVLCLEGNHATIVEAATIPNKDLYLTKKSLDTLKLELSGVPCDNGTVCYKDSINNFSFNCAPNSFFQNLYTVPQLDHNVIDTLKNICVSDSKMKQHSIGHIVELFKCPLLRSVLTAFVDPSTPLIEFYDIVTYYEHAKLCIKAPILTSSIMSQTSNVKKGVRTSNIHVFKAPTISSHQTFHKILTRCLK